MLIKKNKKYVKGDPDFNTFLDHLEEKFYNAEGGPESETIISKTKIELKEEKVVVFSSSNKDVCNLIRRGRDAIVGATLSGDDAILYVHKNAIRPMHCILKPAANIKKNYA
jgi:hypothetical protein